MKRSIWQLFLQIFPVMIGVYLGFLVSDWADDKKRKEESAVLVESLLSEIDINQKQLEGVIEYHSMIRDSCRYYANVERVDERPRFFEGTRIQKLSNSAYNTGVQTGVINELSMDKIQAINQLYTYQKDYDDFGNIVMANLINMDFSENKADMQRIARFLALTMTDIVIKERDLITSYQTVSESLAP